MQLRKWIVGAALIGVAVFSTSLALADEAATVKLRGGWIALGVGTSWGDGVLTLEGCDYPFSIKGLSMGDFGAAGFTASGKVHDLARPEDFNGRYTNVGAGPTVLADGVPITMRNENGVRIDLVFATPGLKVSVGGAGIEMVIPPSSLAAARSPDAGFSRAPGDRALACRSGTRP